MSLARLVGGKISQSSYANMDIFMANFAPYCAARRVSIVLFLRTWLAVHLMGALWVLLYVPSFFFGMLTIKQGS